MFNNRKNCERVDGDGGACLQTEVNFVHLILGPVHFQSTNHPSCTLRGLNFRTRTDVEETFVMNTGRGNPENKTKRGSRSVRERGASSCHVRPKCRGSSKSTASKKEQRTRDKYPGTSTEILHLRLDYPRLEKIKRGDMTS
ncbi:hypothetical protein RUM43_001719 [Polyplax serrata]|uniref:Uncharacterized protein n=1 Tax=Polyplax serrata TaxID=468196 RepID=A0AAN8SIG1_POLSC